MIMHNLISFNISFPFLYFRICIFQSDQVRKRILLLGNPGHGKSMLGRIMALQWADTVKPVDKESHGESEIPDSEPTKEEKELLQKFSVLLFINLSRISPNSSLFNVLSEQIVMSYNDDIRSLIDYIHTHQGDCCLILDGWDEYDPSSCPKLTNIINGRYWPNAYVLTTSRIRQQTVLPENIDLKCMVKGFSKIQAGHFINKMMKAYKNDAQHDILVSFINNHDLWDTFGSPLALNFLCILHLSQLQLSEKVTMLFTNIIQSIIGQQKLKETKQKSSSNAYVPLESNKLYLMALGKLGLSGLTGENTQTVFSNQEVIDTVGESGLKLGILQMVKTTDPTGPVLYQYPHKSIQECVSAIYMANSDGGLDTFLAYFDSLIKVHDHQLLVMFVCGLNPGFGKRLIQNILEISKSSNVTAAQCPEFNYTGWETDNPDDADIAWRHTQVANDVSTFLVKCCLEMQKSSVTDNYNRFPFTTSATVAERIQIKPKINFKRLPVQSITKMIKLEQLSLRSGNAVTCYNIKITKENIHQVSCLFRHLAENTHTVYVNFTNVTCDVKSPVIHDLIQHYGCLLYFDMIDVGLVLSDQELVLQHLSSQKKLVRLMLNKVSLGGCEETLCDTLTKLESLTALFLKSLSVPGWEARLCEAVSHTHQLELLNLNNTDLASAADVLPQSIHCLKKLKYLSLDNTHLTKEQIRQVVMQLPACPELLFLSFDNLPVNAAVRHLQQVLPRLTLLKLLSVNSGKLDTKQVLDIIRCLPTSIQAIEADHNDISDDIVELVKVLSYLPHLQYIDLKLSSVSDDVTQQLREACQEKITLIGSYVEWRQHSALLAKILSAIQHECIGA